MFLFHLAVDSTGLKEALASNEDFLDGLPKKSDRNVPLHRNHLLLPLFLLNNVVILRFLILIPYTLLLCQIHQPHFFCILKCIDSELNSGKHYVDPSRRNLYRLMALNTVAIITLHVN